MNNSQHNLQAALSAIRSAFYGRVPQVFFSRNFVGDQMENIYNDGKISVDACYEQGYIECFGLTNKEKALIEQESQNSRDDTSLQT